MVVLLLVAFYSFVWVELLSNCQSGECTPATALSGAGGLWEIVFVRLMNSTISASAVGSLLKSNESRSVASAMTAQLLLTVTSGLLVRLRRCCEFRILRSSDFGERDSF